MQNRKVHNSKLYTLAFGNPCSVNVDPIEKKPLFHFFPGSRAYSIATAGCNLVVLIVRTGQYPRQVPIKQETITFPGRGS